MSGQASVVDLWDRGRPPAKGGLEARGPRSGAWARQLPDLQDRNEVQPDARWLRATYSSLLAFNSSIGIESALTVLASASARTRRIASGRVGRGSDCAAIHASSPVSSFGSRRTPIDVAFPAGAGPGFRFCGDTIEAFMQFCYHSSRVSEIADLGSEAARQPSRRQTLTGVGLQSDRLLRIRAMGSTRIALSSEALVREPYTIVDEIDCSIGSTRSTDGRRRLSHRAACRTRRDTRGTFAF